MIASGHRLASLRGHLSIPAELTPGEVALSATELGFAVDGRWLLRDVNLDLHAGEIVAVVGPNGAEKPSGSRRALQASSWPGSGRLKYQGMKPISSRTLCAPGVSKKRSPAFQRRLWTRTLSLLALERYSRPRLSFPHSPAISAMAFASPYI